MKDIRIEKLAKLLVNYSVAVKSGDKVLIEAFGVDTAPVKAIVGEVYAAGGIPFVWLRDNEVTRAVLFGASKEQIELMAKYDGAMMDGMDCYIGIRGGSNFSELSDVPTERNKLYSTLYSKPVHHDKRVCNTRWVILRYPTPSMAQLSGTSTEAFEDYFFNVCTLDYAKMDKAMDSLKSLMERTDKVRIVAKDTDISFSIKGIGAKKCSGHCNIPDGEVYSAPIKDSVNGVISYNSPSVQNGVKYENVRLTFINGKIVEATANHTELINKVFDMDEGARYVGEFSLGLNPFINEPMCDILFDEKIAGSIHFTPGCCYDDCNNGNKSALHWDLVLIMTEKYGGGEIYFDDVLIRKNGVFVVDELKGLNAENLAK